MDQKDLKIIIKDVPKMKLLCLESDNFSETKALQLISQILDKATQEKLTISGLPIALIEADGSFSLCLPFVSKKPLKIKDLKVRILPSQRIGSIMHHETQKPVFLSQQFLKRQLEYQGFRVDYPYRYIFHPNPSAPNKPLIEVQAPASK